MKVTFLPESLNMGRVPDRFNRSISRSPVNFKKIGEGHIFARITQYGSRLFGIDASSDPAKFQGDWPCGRP